MGKLTREAVVEQALRIGDAEGLQAVTIRRLAQDLGVTPMALYWHFKNKEQLTVGMADHLVHGFVVVENHARPWNDQLRELVAGLVRVLRRHPCAASVLEEVDQMEVPSFLRVWDTALGLTRRAGFTHEESCLISKYLLRGTTALAAGPANRRPGMTEREAAESARVKRITFQSLPQDAYPHIVEMAVPLVEGCATEVYDTFGVDLLMSGIEALAARRTGGDLPRDGAGDSSR
ncbi:TetR family transcriptional regulator [Streptosporangium sp. NPDC051022]|uniref:TetR/AcrR family transcriptional regulator n=1 Tax=Streptosporangium sp. NPDC051022 TaxID=3155752 RepID=UPI00342BC134